MCDLPTVDKCSLMISSSAARDPTAAAAAAAAAVTTSSVTPGTVAVPGHPTSIDDLTLGGATAAAFALSKVAAMPPKGAAKRKQPASSQPQLQPTPPSISKSNLTSKVTIAPTSPNTSEGRAVSQAMIWVCQ